MLHLDRLPAWAASGLGSKAPGFTFVCEAVGAPSTQVGPFAVPDGIFFRLWTITHERSNSGSGRQHWSLSVALCGLACVNAMQLLARLLSASGVV